MNKSKRQNQSDLSLADYRALADFRYQIRRYLKRADAGARNAGLHPKQYQLLLALKGLPNGVKPSIGILAEQLQIRHNSAVELVNRLEKHKLVVRFRDPSQRSFVHVRITRKGESLLGKLVQMRREELRISGPVLVRTLKTLTLKKSTP